MKNQNANVIVYLQQPVRKDQVKQISSIVNSMRGVLNARTSDRRKSLLSVDYDPFSTNSKHILNCVREQGQKAVLVGM